MKTRAQKILLRLLVLVCHGLAVAAAPGAFAQSTPGTGAVVGQVQNQRTGAYLEGAEVAIDGTALTAFTTRDGSFTVRDVPTGKRAVTISYTGLDPQTVPVEIMAGGVARVEIGLTSKVYALEAFTVASSREGNAAALTRQRNAVNVMNIMSMDAYGNVADGNIGNMLQKMVGFAPIKDAGDIVGLSLRGMPPDQNSITLDGARAAGFVAGSTSLGDRAGLIDHIPSEFIKEIEVAKALTPDMPADSLGGAVNLVTKSAFDFKGRFVSYRAGANLNTQREGDNRWSPGGSVTYLDTFGKDRNFGFVLSASLQSTRNPRDRAQVTRPLATDERVSQIRTLDDSNDRVRIGVVGKFEYKLDNTARFWVTLTKYNYSMDTTRVDNRMQAPNTNVADYSVVSRAAIFAGETPRTTAGAVAGIAPGFTRTFSEILGGFNYRVSAYEKRRSYHEKFEVGGEKTWDNSKLEFSASYNPAYYQNLFNTLIMNTANVLGFSVDTSKSFEDPVYRQIYGSPIGVNANYNNYVGRYTTEPGRTEEEITTFRADYVYHVKGTRFPVTLKTGTNLRRQHRNFYYDTYEYNYTGADGVRGLNPATGLNDDNWAQFMGQGAAYGIFNNSSRFPIFSAGDVYRLGRAFEANPANFSTFFIRRDYLTAREITEDVLAGYVQGKATFGKLTLLGGVRVEKTDVQATGQFNDSRDPRPVIGRSGDYKGTFPSLHARYEITRGLLLHASYSASASRAPIGQLVPNTNVSYDSVSGLGSVNTANPALLPQESDNYDLSLEYYFEPAGVLSAAFFKKDIVNYLAREDTIIGTGPNNGFDGRYAGFFLNRTINLGTADVEGYEFNYNQQFRFLPKPFNGLGMFANYTHIKTQGRYVGGAGELANFIPTSKNIGFSFNYGRYDLRASYSYRSGFLNNFNTALQNKNFWTDDGTYDITVQYRLRPALTFYVDLVNLTNNAPSLYNIHQDRVLISEKYGARVNVGISGRF